MNIINKIKILSNAPILICISVSVAILITSYVSNKYSLNWLSNTLLNTSCGLLGGIIAAYILNYKKKTISRKYQEYKDFKTIWASVDKCFFAAHQYIREFYKERNTQRVLGYVQYMFEKVEYYHYDLSEDVSYGVSNQYKIRFIKPMLEKFKDEEEVFNLNIKHLSNDDLLEYAFEIGNKLFRMNSRIIYIPGKELFELERDKLNVERSIL